METNDYQNNELQREWRQIVLTKLDSLEKSQKEIEEKLVKFAMSTVQINEHKALEDRVRLLEETKIKLLVAWAFVQGFTFVIGWLIATFLK